MNFRHYALYFIIGLLTFLIGVTSAVVIGHVNPFPRARVHRRCGQFSGSLNNRRPFVFTVYRSDGTVLKSVEVETADEVEKLKENMDADAPKATVVIDNTGSNR